MNVGRKDDAARQHAQANADRSGEPWVLTLYGGTWWADRLSSYTSGKAPDNAVIIHPRTRKREEQPKP